MAGGSVKRVPVTRIKDNESSDTADALAVEEPLEVQLEYGPAGNRKIENISVTMRTPGHDAELAAGFLFTEGIISSPADIDGVDYCFVACTDNRENVIRVTLKENVTPNLKNANRNFYTTSSCGVCGKSSISAIRTARRFAEPSALISITAELLHRLPDKLRQQQKVFADTGGLHAAALFDADGRLLLVREDVGRHNGLDKLIGAALNKNWLPLCRSVLLLSGRASFELVQKAAMAGIQIIAAVGAPSSLAVELAEEFNITLAGFLRDRRFNIYTAGHRIKLPVYEDSY